LHHPFLKNIKFLVIYLIIWVIVAIIHIIFEYFFYNQSFGICVVESLIMNFSFALFSFPSWFVINYIHISKQTLFNQFFNNFTTIVVVLALWVGFHFTVLNYLYSDNYNYILFLETSIPVRILVGIFFYITLFLIFKIIIYYEDYEEKSQRENLLLRKINEAELSLLKSQINPHFLFNSLNSISLLTVTEPVNAREMIIKMSDFLRYSISQTETKFTTLEKELRNVERYLDIEKNPIWR